MRLGGWQKISLIDYPGKIATVAFTLGCNFRCPYCHNVSLVFPSSMAGGLAEETLMAFLNDRWGKIGAVVVSGGEPTLQPDLIPFLHRLRRRDGLSVKLDTNGSRPSVLQRIFQQGLVDYVAMDIKAPANAYDSAAGVPVDMSLLHESLQLIRESGVAYEFRTTVVNPVCPLDALDDIVACLDKKDPYFLQPFCPQGGVLKAEVLRFPQPQPEDIRRAAQDLSHRWPGRTIRARA